MVILAPIITLNNNYITFITYCEVKIMKAYLEIVELKNDVITTSGDECVYEACPGLEWDEFAMEG